MAQFFTFFYIFTFFFQISIIFTNFDNFLQVGQLSHTRVSALIWHSPRLGGDGTFLQYSSHLKYWSMHCIFLYCHNFKSIFRGGFEARTSIVALVWPPSLVNLPLLSLSWHHKPKTFFEIALVFFSLRPPPPPPTPPPPQQQISSVLPAFASALAGPQDLPLLMSYSLLLQS